jgi:hypothetical protein
MVLDVNQHNNEVLGTLEVGDLVEIDRGCFQHWGVYIGTYQIFTNVLCPAVEYLYSWHFFSHFIRIQFLINDLDLGYDFIYWSGSICYVLNPLYGLYKCPYNHMY